MELQQLNTSTQAGSPSTPAQSQQSATALSSDFETFLLMLTTQMENQDPLNPIESEDFAVQLATFSGVEQQVRTNALLEDLVGGLGLTGLSELAGWVGMEARVVSQVSFDGTPVELASTPAPGAEGAELVVLDEFGREVGRESVPLTGGTFLWAGTGPDGQPLPQGLYSLELISMSGGEEISTSPVAHYTRIGEARQGFDGIELVLNGGVIVPSDSVTALRQPESS